MRTKEQITNLRRVLVGLYGPGVLFFSDDMINGWADVLQYNIDSIPHEWNLRVRTVDDKDVPFEEIRREPKVIRATKNQIVKKVEEMMTEYPRLHSIQFVIVGSPNDILSFERDGNTYTVL